LIKQAILNVVVNAIEAMKDGGQLKLATAVLDRKPEPSRRRRDHSRNRQTVWKHTGMDFYRLRFELLRCPCGCGKLDSNYWDERACSTSF
jgi:signal transduction histidine kinase